jgi:hypothetical protein
MHMLCSSVSFVGMSDSDSRHGNQQSQAQSQSQSDGFSIGLLLCFQRATLPKSVTGSFSIEQVSYVEKNLIAYCRKYVEQNVLLDSLKRSYEKMRSETPLTNRGHEHAPTKQHIPREVSDDEASASGTDDGDASSLSSFNTNRDYYHNTVPSSGQHKKQTSHGPRIPHDKDSNNHENEYGGKGYHDKNKDKEGMVNSFIHSSNAFNTSEVPTPHAKYVSSEYVFEHNAQQGRQYEQYSAAAAAIAAPETVYRATVDAHTPPLYGKYNHSYEHSAVVSHKDDFEVYETKHNPDSSNTDYLYAKAKYASNGVSRDGTTVVSDSTTGTPETDSSDLSAAQLAYRRLHEHELSPPPPPPPFNYSGGSSEYSHGYYQQQQQHQPRRLEQRQPYQQDPQQEQRSQERYAPTSSSSSSSSSSTYPRYNNNSPAPTAGAGRFAAATPAQPYRPTAYSPPSSSPTPELYDRDGRYIGAANRGSSSNGRGSQASDVLNTSIASSSGVGGGSGAKDRSRAESPAPFGSSTPRPTSIKPNSNSSAMSASVASSQREVNLSAEDLRIRYFFGCIYFLLA